MSKPMKPKTTGLSAGPTAYWDARSDAMKDADNERLQADNERLRGLMRNLVKNAEGGDYGEIIVLDVDFIEIEKEVGDE
jgi:hypothetical protein